MDMDSSWPESLTSDLRKAAEELIRGRELANELQFMLRERQRIDGSVSAEDLAVKIWGSFCQTLSILNSGDSADEVSQVPAIPRDRSPCWSGRKSEDSGESNKTSGSKNRRGCYRRRKISHTSTRITPTLIDDGHAWRKYGQKSILNADHPRNYYRCSHKFDQGCHATKQVQRTEDDPPMYRTTYHGHHTCKNTLKSHQIILDSTSRDSSILLSFETNNQNNKLDSPLFFPSIKQEYKQDLPSPMNHNQSSPTDYLLSHDQMELESSRPMTVMSTGGSDHGDVISNSGVYSCTESTHSLEMDTMMLGSGDFDDVLQFVF